MKNCGLCGVGSPPVSFPLLIVFTEIGSPVPGTVAQFVPLTKNAKTSFTLEFEKSLYSSEVKTYWNVTCDPDETKSNCSAVASNVSNPESAVSSGSPGLPKSVVLLVPSGPPSSWQLFGPSTPREQGGSPGTVWTLPLPRRMPPSKPMMPCPPPNVPAAGLG